MFINNTELYDLKLIYTSLEQNENLVSNECLSTLAKIIERVETQKAKRSGYAAKYMSEKRKQDKTYGQTYERKNKILGL